MHDGYRIKRPSSKSYIYKCIFYYLYGHTVYPKKYAHGFCFAVLCCGYTLTDIPISTRLTSLALWLSNDCPSASKATLMNMDKYFMWIHCERLHNHNKAKHNKTVCIFLGIYCSIENIGSQSTHAFCDGLWPDFHQQNSATLEKERGSEMGIKRKLISSYHSGMQRGMTSSSNTLGQIKFYTPLQVCLCDQFPNRNVYTHQSKREIVLLHWWPTEVTVSTVVGWWFLAITPTTLI